MLRRRLGLLLLAVEGGLARRLAEPAEPREALADAASALAAASHGADPDAARALRDVELAMARGGDADPGHASAVVLACTRFIAHVVGAELRSQALAVLARIAAGPVGPQILAGVVAGCNEAVARADVPHREILWTLDLVVESPLADKATLSSVVQVAARLMQSERPFWDSADSKARILFDTMASIGSFAQPVARDDELCMSIVRAARFVIENTDDESVHGFLSVRFLVIDMLEDIVRAASSDEVLVEVLCIIEHCLSHGRWALIVHAVAHLLGDIAGSLADAHIGRVIAICSKETMAVQQGARRAMRPIAQRLLRGASLRAPEDRLLRLAESLVLMDRLHEPLPCSDAFELMTRLQTPQVGETAVQVLLQLGERNGWEPPIDLAMHIDEFVPPLPDVAARLEIVAVCARSGDRRDRSFPQALLRAACLLPWRVGLMAAAAFARAARPPLSWVIVPADFQDVGACLLEGVLAAHGASLPLAASSSQRIAAVVLGVAPAVVDAWPAAHQRIGLRPLCAVVGGMHDTCRRLAPPHRVLQTV